MTRVVSHEDNKDNVTLDLSAAVWGGVVGAIAFVVVKFLLLNAGTAGIWGVFRPIATLVLRERIVDPAWESSPITLILGILLHILLSIIFAFILTFILHRWGFLVGLLGGALFGLALYIINYYTFSFFFPWFFVEDSGWVSAVAHAVFGASAGGTYELLEEKHARGRETV